MDLKDAVPFVGRKGAIAPNGPTMRTIYNVETGQAVVTKAINATEAVAGGHWSFTQPGSESDGTGGPGSPSSRSGDAAAVVTRELRAKVLGELKKDELVGLVGSDAQAADTKAVLITKILDREFPAS